MNRCTLNTNYLLFACFKYVSFFLLFTKGILTKSRVREKKQPFLEIKEVGLYLWLWASPILFRFIQYENTCFIGWCQFLILLDKTILSQGTYNWFTGGCQLCVCVCVCVCACVCVCVCVYSKEIENSMHTFAFDYQKFICYHKYRWCSYIK